MLSLFSHTIKITQILRAQLLTGALPRQRTSKEPPDHARDASTRMGGRMLPHQYLALDVGVSEGDVMKVVSRAMDEAVLLFRPFVAERRISRPPPEIDFSKRGGTARCDVGDHALRAGALLVNCVGCSHSACAEHRGPLSAVQAALTTSNVEFTFLCDACIREQRDDDAGENDDDDIDDEADSENDDASQPASAAREEMLEQPQFFLTADTLENIDAKHSQLVNEVLTSSDFSAFVREETQSHEDGVASLAWNDIVGNVQNAPKTIKVRAHVLGDGRRSNVRDEHVGAFVAQLYDVPATSNDRYRRVMSRHNENDAMYGLDV